MVSTECLRVTSSRDRLYVLQPGDSIWLTPIWGVGWDGSVSPIFFFSLLVYPPMETELDEEDWLGGSQTPSWKDGSSPGGSDSAVACPTLPVFQGRGMGHCSGSLSISHLAALKYTHPLIPRAGFHHPPQYPEFWDRSAYLALRGTCLPPGSQTQLH